MVQEANYHVSKQNVELLLAFRELDDHISDPKPALNRRELEEGKMNVAKARAIIGASLSNEHLEPAWGTENPFAMWA